LLKVINKALLGLKTGKYHIFSAWILLVCFIAGQYMVYAHQHYLNKPGTVYHITSKDVKETVKEKCSFCDAMHCNAMVKANGIFFNPDFVSTYTFKPFKYSFKSLSLILSCGRAPPFANFIL